MINNPNVVSSGGGKTVTGTFDYRTYCACETPDGPVWVTGENVQKEVLLNSLLFVLNIDAEPTGNLQEIGRVDTSLCYKVLGDFEILGYGIS